MPHPSCCCRRLQCYCAQSDWHGHYQHQLLLQCRQLLVVMKLSLVLRLLLMLVVTVRSEPLLALLLLLLPAFAVALLASEAVVEAPLLGSSQLGKF